MSTTPVPVLVRPVTDPKAREDRRRLAVQRVLEGETQAAVAASLKVSVRSVSNWMTWYRGRGEDGLKAVPHPGPEFKLSAAAQERTVCSSPSKTPPHSDSHRPVDRAPRRQADPGPPGIAYNPANHFRRWSGKHDFTLQKPCKVAAQRTRPESPPPPKREWPAIVRVRVAHVVLIDETGLQLSSAWPAVVDMGPTTRPPSTRRHPPK